MKRICVYCGSSHGAKESYAEAGRQLGQILADRGIGLVFGGGAVGIMGEIADAVLGAGGEVIGVIPEALAVKEVAHERLTEQHVVPSMHVRKAMMADLSDGFIALPGGWGTMEEIFEILTWAQLGFHDKPCGMLNVDGYYDGIFSWIHHAIDEDFVKPVFLEMLHMDEDPERLLERFEQYKAPVVRKWITREET